MSENMNNEHMHELYDWSGTMSFSGTILSPWDDVKRDLRKLARETGTKVKFRIVGVFSQELKVEVSGRHTAKQEKEIVSKFEAYGRNLNARL